MSMKVLKTQPIIELKDIVVQFPSRDGSLFNPKKFTAVGGVSLNIRAGGNFRFGGTIGVW